jgi:hypothetical protein
MLGFSASKITKAICVVTCTLWVTSGCEQRPLPEGAIDAIPRNFFARLTNAPDKVQADPKNPNVLSGTFTIRGPEASEPNIASEGGGGACVLAQYPVEPKPCSVDAECGGPIGPTQYPTVGYCVSEGATAANIFGHPVNLPGSNGTCWVRPDDKDASMPHTCHVGVRSGVHTVSTDDLAAFVKVTGAKKWRLYTCLNGTVAGSCRRETAVEGKEVLHRAGDVYPG